MTAAVDLLDVAVPLLDDDEEIKHLTVVTGPDNGRFGYQCTSGECPDVRGTYDTPEAAAEAAELHGPLAPDCVWAPVNRAREVQ